MERDTIFIGHATPEDNEFTLWLQSKLINEGYNCECDLSFLIGGEADYWKNIQDFLENRTIKYILVVSNETFTKSGVLDEWEHCKSIEKYYHLSDFIIPVKIDNSPYNIRIGLNRKNLIPFEDYWAKGLKILLKKLQHDQVPKENTTNLSINDWYKNVYTNWSGITDENDTFFSNWIRINEIPKNIYFFKLRNEEQARAILKTNIVYPAYRHGNIIVTFQHSLDFFLIEQGFEISPLEVIIKNTKAAFSWYYDTEFPAYNDLRRLLVRLISICFEDYLKSRELIKFDLSNSKSFYFEHKPDDKAKGKFIVNNKSKNIGVTGKYYDSYWHFAISFKPLFYPEFCLSIKNHIIFSDDGKTAWKDDKQLHKARRNKGKTMHNKEWRDQLLAFLASISNSENGDIIIPSAEDENIIISATPILFKANFSYNEPNDTDRLKPIDSFLDEEDFYESESDYTIND